MRQVSAAVISFLCGSCAQLAGEPTPSVDKYSIAAMSWRGAYIEDMVAAWPHPQEKCRSKTVSEGGCVHWRHHQGGGGNTTPAFNYRCEAIAHFDAAGVITRVEVRESLNCHRRFEWHFDRMTRPHSPDLESEMEELRR